MNAKAPVAPGKSYLLLNHGPVVLVSSAADARCNVMAAAWSMPLDFDPPKVAVVIDRNTLTHELVTASGEFVLNIPPRRLARATLGVGSVSGREIDKFSRFGLRTEPASRVAAPLIAGCVGWLECRVLPESASVAQLDLVLAEVVAASSDPAVFADGRWCFTDPAMATIHYRAGGYFFATGEAFAVNA